MEYQDLLDTLLEKSNGENDLTYEEICDSFGLSISPTTLRKSWNSICGGRAVYQYLTDKMDNPTETEEEIRRLQDIKRDLVKERTRLQDQRRIVNKDIREEARFENLKDAMLDAIGELEPIVWNDVEFKNEGKEAALLFSDIHYGLKIDTPLNYFDAEVCKERIAKLCEKTIKYCRLHNVTKLNVCMLGDFINGLIQQSSRVDQEEDCISQLMGFCEIATQMLNELNNNIDEVVVYSTFGNHERNVANKKESVNRENFGRLVPFYLKARLPQLKIVDSHGVDYIEAIIGGKKTVMTHGDKDTVDSCSVNFTRILGYMPEQVFLGHTHDFCNVDKDGVDVVVNGCVDGQDEYALTLRRNSKPHQVLRIYDDDVATYKIDL